tara:strand:- start:320 stop:517 length:198 start_codon:yes stop_codon:yes gene_type:complete
MLDLGRDQRALEQSGWIGLGTGSGHRITEYTTGKGTAAFRRFVLPDALQPFEVGKHFDRLDVVDR